VHLGEGGGGSRVGEGDARYGNSVGKIAQSTVKTGNGKEFYCGVLDSHERSLFDSVGDGAIKIDDLEMSILTARI
jgi:hypothetical protein